MQHLFLDKRLRLVLSTSYKTAVLVYLNTRSEQMLDWRSVKARSYDEALKLLRKGEKVIAVSCPYQRREQKSLVDFLSEVSLNTSCTYLSLAENDIQPWGGGLIAKALENNRTLAELNLLGNKIGQGTGEIARALRINVDMSLTSLNLRNNNIGPQGAREIAHALEVNTSLAVVNLCNNWVGSQGAIEVAGALRKNTTLTTLFLDNNYIGDDGGKQLAKCIRQNTESALILISLNNNEISKEGRLLLVELASIRPDLNISIVEKEDVETQRKRIAQTVMNEKLPYGWCKLMVIGEGEAGKTQTVRSLMDLHFQPDHNSTAGGEIQFTHADSLFTRIGDQDRRDRNDMLLYEAASRVSTKRPNGSCKEFNNSINSLRPKQNLLETRKNVRERERASENPNENLLDAGASVLGRKSLSRNARRVQKELQNKNRLHFTIWDFAGQNVYKAVHHLFLTDGGLHLLVFNMFNLVSRDERLKSGSIKDIVFWVKSVTMYSKNPQIVFIGTHLDQCSEGDIDRVNEILIATVLEEYDIAEENSKGLYYYPVVNCNEGRTKKTFAEIRAELVRRAKALKSVTQEVSMKWVLFFSCLWDRQADREERCHYLPLQKMKEWLEGFKITGEESEELLEFCHRMGMILRWNNIEILKETVILNPQYIIDAAARIMHDKGLHERILSEKKVTLSQFRMKKAYKEMHDSGYISSGLLREVLWSDGAFRSNLKFLQELFKVALLMCEYKKENNDEEDPCEDFIVPSLLMNLRKEEASDQRELVVKEWRKLGFGYIADGAASVVQSKLVFKWLPPGFFERLACVCIKVGELEQNLIAPRAILFCVESPVGFVPIHLRCENDRVEIKLLSGEQVPALDVVLDIKTTAESILREEMQCTKKECAVFLLGKDLHEFLLTKLDTIGEQTTRVLDKRGNNLPIDSLGAWRIELLRQRTSVERGPRFVYMDIKGQLSPDEFDSKLKSKKSEFKEKEEAYEEARGSLDSLESVVGALNALMNGPVKLIASIWQDAMKHKSEDKDRTLYYYSNKVSLFLNDPDLRPLQKIETWIKEICLVLDNFEPPEHRFGLFLSHQGIKRDEDNYEFRYRKDKMYELYRFFQERLRMREDAEVPVFFDAETLISGDPQIEWMLFSAFYSDKVLLFIDKDYFKKKWCLMEYFLALHGQGSVHPFLLDFNRDCVPFSLPNTVVPKGIEKCKSENFVNSLNKHFGTKSRSEYTDRYNTMIA